MMMKSYRRCIRASSFLTSSTTLVSGKPERRVPLGSTSRGLSRPIVVGTIASGQVALPVMIPARVAAGGDSERAGVRPDPQHTCDTTSGRIDVDKQRAPRLISSGSGQVGRNR